ncbi:MAG TPA: 1-acyl-sn-glycerol-3-phosphate acyltransferase [Chitinophagaceae bacterium]|nr:1-acyl-sn-glycerol-3-phosphate acyltransferase [Chitinophagaceae bacterium]
MLYSILKLIARIAIRFFCRKVIINKPELLKIKGPVLLACNHPNSFLDSVIFDTLFQQPVWNLARGDAFKNKFYVRLLTALKILPVYRTSEGTENLSENYKTFDACISIFRQNGIVAIFSEGKCINEWHLRRLKKGTARLAIKAWEEGIPLRVLPLGINYSSFSRFGKNIFLNFGEIITANDVNLKMAEGLRHQSFNDQLRTQLEKLVFEIPKTDRQAQAAKLEIKPSLLKKILLPIPATIGWLIHLPLYLPVKYFVWKRTFKNDHYDSVMMVILLFTYPVYLLIIITMLWIILHCWWIVFLLVLAPFTAWSYIQLKPQLDK